MYFILQGLVYYCLLVINGSALNLSALDDEFHHVLRSVGQNKENRNENNSQRNENKNQGLINTIINHNSKLEHIENKFNLMVNNFANSSHIKEIVGKTSELEKLIYGPPQPHRILLKLAQKYACPWLITHLRRQFNQKNTKQFKINEQQTRRNHDAVVTISDLLASLEGKIDEQRREMQLIVRQQICKNMCCLICACHIFRTLLLSSFPSFCSLLSFSSFLFLCHRSHLSFLSFYSTPSLVSHLSSFTIWASQKRRKIVPLEPSWSLGTTSRIKKNLLFDQVNYILFRFSFPNYEIDEIQLLEAFIKVIIFKSRSFSLS